MLPNPAVYPSNTMPAYYADYWCNTSVRIGDALPYNSGWDDSIAVSQSTTINAPFNTIDYIFVDSNDVIHRSKYRKNLQKIALYGFTSWDTSGNFSYYNSGAQSTMDFWHIAAKRRKGGNDAFNGSLGAYSTTYNNQVWSQLRTNWDSTRYYLVTGLNPQKCLGVIYVGFYSGGSCTYCSLKDYLTNYSALTPNFAFMVVYIERPSGYSSYHAVAPIDMQPREYKLFKRVDNDTGDSFNFGEFIDAYPGYMTKGVSKKSNYNYGTYKTITNANAFPLCGLNCGYYTKRNWTQGLNELHGVPVFGAAEDNYTITYDGSIFTTELTEEAIRLLPNMAATYGLPFTDDYITDEYNLYTGNKKTYMPYSNAYGYYNGSYELLTDNGVVSEDLSPENATLWEDGIEGMWEDRTYTPKEPEPIDSVDLTEPAITPVGSFNKTFILNKQEVDSIQDYIYGADDTTLENFLKGISNFGGSPMDAFISLHLWPFDVRSFVTASTTAPVVVGRTTISPSPQGDVIGYLMPTDAKAVVDCGSFMIEPKFESFLDYEPYTTINLFIPFIGSVDLPPSLYMGKKVAVKLICDWITGATTAVIYADGIPLIYQQGVGAVSISMTGDNHSRTAGDVIGGLIGAGASAVGAVAAGYTGQWGMAAKLGFNAAEQLSEARNDYGKTDFTQAGSSSPMCGLYMPMYCYITISRPKLLYNAAAMAEYARGVGYADSRVTTLAAEAAAGSGIVVGAPVRVSFSGSVYPTPGELEEIVAALASGVFPD